MSFSVLCRASELLSLGGFLQRGFSLLLGAVLHADWVLFYECLMMVFKKINIKMAMVKFCCCCLILLLLFKSLLGFAWVFMPNSLVFHCIFF